MWSWGIEYPPYANRFTIVDSNVATACGFTVEDKRSLEGLDSVVVIWCAVLGRGRIGLGMGAIIRKYIYLVRSPARLLIFLIHSIELWQSKHEDEPEQVLVTQVGVY